MKALIFDTETTGLIDKRHPMSHPAQPHIVQLAYAVIDLDTWVEVSAYSTILSLPVGVEVPAAAAKVHGITTERTRKEGRDPWCELARWVIHALEVDVLVAHNMAFDRYLVGANLLRYALRPPDRLRAVPRLCTMEASEPILKLPFPGRSGPGADGKWKWPRLDEAYRHYTGRTLEGAHDALVDVRGCAAVLQQMLWRHEIELPALVGAGP